MDKIIFGIFVAVIACIVLLSLYNFINVYQSCDNGHMARTVWGIWECVR